MSILKKIFFLSVFVFVLSLLFWGIYKLSFKDNSATVADKTSTKPATPVAAANKIEPVSGEAVIAPTLAADGNSLNYFLEKSGQLLQVDFYGKVQQTLSAKNISNLSDAYWSIDKLKLVIKTKASDNGATFSFLDLASGETKPLKDNLDEVAWQTNANRILYKYYSPETKERTLNVADPDGSNWTKIADLNYKSLSVAQIPKTGLISFWNTGDAYVQTNFQAIPLLGGTAKTILATGFGADYLWNFSGDWALISHSDSQGGAKMELGMVNVNGGEYKNLGIPTFIDKCVWAENGQAIYYALPGGIPDNSVLPNDYKAGKFKTADTFWKVNIKTGEKTRLIETADIPGQYDASQLFLNKSESLLFFVNKIDGKLYRLTL